LCKQITTYSIKDGGNVTYIICGIPCIEVCMESDHKKSFFYAGRYFVKLSDYYEED